jgi:hypothetical protein
MVEIAQASEAGLDQQNDAAVQETRRADRIEPRMAGVEYDSARGMILVKLRGGYVFGFPPSAIEGLKHATANQISDIRISPTGDGLHWEELGVDVSLTGLMTRALNLREWAPRIMGQIRSEAKAKAARRNGLKGGRPRGSTGSKGRP